MNNLFVNLYRAFVPERFQHKEAQASSCNVDQDLPRHIDNPKDQHSGEIVGSFRLEHLAELGHVNIKSTIKKIVFLSPTQVKTISDPSQIWHTDLLLQLEEAAESHLFLQIYMEGDKAECASLCISRVSDLKKEVHHFTIYDLNTPLRHIAQGKPQIVKIKIDHKSIRGWTAEYDYVQQYDEPSTRELRKILSKYEWALVEHLEKETAVYYYYGRKAIAKKCYIQSIKPLKYVYEVLKERWYQTGLTVYEMKLMTETAFWIGHVYLKLNQYDQAYAFLELTSRFNQEGYRYKKEFINCLVHSRNLLSILYIDDYLKEYCKGKQQTSSLEFCEFLLHRKSFLLIEMDLLDEAEKILLSLLEKHPDRPAILNELAYIQEERRKKSIKST